MPIGPLPDDTREAIRLIYRAVVVLENEVDYLRDSIHRVWHNAPTKPREGMLVFADGTDWDPDTTGNGGYFQYLGGVWVAL